MSKARGTHLRRLPPDPAKNALTIAGTTYQWELRHGPGTWPDGTPRGLSISVWAEKDQTRELILDFPFRRYAATNPSQEELEESLTEAIPVALDAGWVPDSRGRRFRLELEESAN